MKTFPVFDNLPYPDGSPFEIFANGTGTLTICEDKVNLEGDPDRCDPYIEVEIRSLLVDPKPGQQYAFQVHWHHSVTDEGPITRVNLQCRDQKTL